MDQSDEEIYQSVKNKVSISVGAFNARLIQLRLICVILGIFFGATGFCGVIRENSILYSIGMAIIGCIGGVVVFLIVYHTNEKQTNILTNPVECADYQFYRGGGTISLSPLRKYKTLIDPFYTKGKDGEKMIKYLSEKVIDSLSAETFIGH